MSNYFGGGPRPAPSSFLLPCQPPPAPPAQPQHVYSMMSQQPAYNVPYGNGGQSQLMGMLANSPSSSQASRPEQMQMYRGQQTTSAPRKMGPSPQQPHTPGTYQQSPYGHQQQPHTPQTPTQQDSPGYHQAPYNGQQRVMSRPPMNAKLDQGVVCQVSPPRQCHVDLGYGTIRPRPPVNNYIRGPRPSISGDQFVLPCQPAPGPRPAYMPMQQPRPQRVYPMMNQQTAYNVSYGNGGQSQLIGMLANSPSSSQAPRPDQMQAVYRGQQTPTASRKMGPSPQQPHTPGTYQQSPYGHQQPPTPRTPTPQQDSPGCYQAQYNGQQRVISRPPINTDQDETDNGSPKKAKVVPNRTPKPMPGKVTKGKHAKKSPEQPNSSLGPLHNHLLAPRPNAVIVPEVLDQVSQAVDPKMVLEENVKTGVALYIEALVDDLIKETARATMLRKSKQVKNKDLDFVLRKFNISMAGASGSHQPSSTSKRNPAMEQRMAVIERNLKK